MSTRDVSSKQENFVALMLGGTTTPNSGAGHTKKGDILIDDFGVVECKTKMKPCTSFSIKKEWIDTVRKEAFEMNRTDWAIVFDFGVLGDEYAVIPLSDYREFLEYKRGNK